MHGHAQATMASDVPVPTKAHIGDKLKRANIVTATDAFDTNAIGIVHFISDAQVLQFYNFQLVDSVDVQSDGALVMASEVLPGRDAMRRPVRGSVDDVQRRQPRADRCGVHRRRWTCPNSTAAPLNTIIESVAHDTEHREMRAVHALNVNLLAERLDKGGTLGQSRVAYNSHKPWDTLNKPITDAYNKVYLRDSDTDEVHYVKVQSAFFLFSDSSLSSRVRAKSLGV